MIAVHVTFEHPAEDWAPDQLRLLFEPTVSNYVGRPHLLSKTYWIDEARRQFGGFYLWESEEAARAHYEDGFVERATARFGAPPQIRYLSVAFQVDNPREPAAV